MSKGVLLRWLGVICFAVSSLPWFLPAVPREEQSSFSFEGSVIKFGPKPTMCPEFGRFGRDFALDVEFVYRPGGFQNLFQTDNQNFGVRIEINPSGQIATLIGRGGSNSFTTLLVGEPLVPGNLVELKLELSRHGKATFRVNDVVVTVKFAMLFSCADVRIGIGYDDTRPFQSPFHGRIVNTAVEPRYHLTEIQHSLLFIVALFSIALSKRRSPYSGRH